MNPPCRNSTLSVSGESMGGGRGSFGGGDGYTLSLDTRDGGSDFDFDVCRVPG